MKKILLMLPLAFSFSVFSAEIDQTSQLEIKHLFKALESSDCKFNRNGSWYTAHEASLHLQKKYKYLVDHHAISTTESFIENAATKSSLSGKVYLVQCSAAKLIESKQWFISTLKNYRAEHHD